MDLERLIEGVKIVGVKCSKAINESEITRSFRVSENLRLLVGGGVI